MDPLVWGVKLTRDIKKYKTEFIESEKINNDFEKRSWTLSFIIKKIIVIIKKQIIQEKNPNIYRY